MLWQVTAQLLLATATTTTTTNLIAAAVAAAVSTSTAADPRESRTEEAEKENLMREKREERFARIEDALNRIVEEELKIKEIEQEQRRPWFGL